MSLSQLNAVHTAKSKMLCAQQQLRAQAHYTKWQKKKIDVSL